MYPIKPWLYPLDALPLKHPRHPSHLMKQDRHGTSRILSQEEYREVLRVLKPQHRTLLKVLCATGFRISECLSIRKQDLVENTIILRKNDSKGKLETREVPIPPSLAAELQAIKTEGEYFFSARDPHKPMTRQNIDASFRSACSYLGIEGTSYITHADGSSRNSPTQMFPSRSSKRQ